MKKDIAILVMAVILLGGCKKALDETAFSSIYTKDFYSSPLEAESAITAVYGGLYDLYSAGGTLFAAEWSADQMFPRNVVGRSSLPLFTYDPQFSVQTSFNRSNESPLDTWTQAYKGIEQANWVIEKVALTNMDTIRRGNILGEAYFLRAFFHWMLTKNFGEIIIKTAASNSLDKAYETKSTTKAVYQQIYKDLDQAISLLPDYTPSIVKGRVSRQVAQLLYAKAALYDENWPAALEKANVVMTSGKYSLDIPYTDIFNVVKEDIARQEVVFAVELNNTLNPIRWSQMHYFCAPVTNPTEYSKGGAGAMYVYSAFYKSFNPIDKRRLLLDTNYKDATGAIVPQARIDTRLATKDLVLLGKYKDPNAIGAYGSNNICILRYADAYLIAAEAEARQNGATVNAYKFINAVRKRAGIPDLTAGLGKQPFIDSVMKERSWEFFGEADRWYDLTRTNTFTAVIPTAVNADYPVRTPLPKHRYFPIPQMEINANPKIKQNTGWE